jgi:hypothetical protein
MTPTNHAFAQAGVSLESLEFACYTHASYKDIHSFCPGRRS